MKILKLVVGLGLSVFIIASFSSCRKIQEDLLVKGLWGMTAFYIDSTNENIMNTQLQYFSNGNDCCEYKIYFEQDGIAFGYYNTYDTSNFIVQGTWELIEYNKIYMNLDRFMDGTFKITKTAEKKYTFSSEANHIRAYDAINPVLDTTKCHFDVERL